MSLTVEKIYTSYGLSQILFGVSLKVGDGEVVSLVPENARRIRQAIKNLRAQLRSALSKAPRHFSVSDLQVRFDACFAEMKKMATYRHDAGTQAALKGLIAYSRRGLSQIENALPAPIGVPEV